MNLRQRVALCLQDLVALMELKAPHENDETVKRTFEEVRKILSGTTFFPREDGKEDEVNVHILKPMPV